MGAPGRGPEGPGPGGVGALLVRQPAARVRQSPSVSAMSGGLRAHTAQTMARKRKTACRAETRLTNAPSTAFVRAPVFPCLPARVRAMA